MAETGNPLITPERVLGVAEGTFPGSLGIEPIEIAPDRVVARLQVDRRHLHPGGYVHGGCWTAFADTVAAWGTMRRLPPDTAFTTVELKLNLFSAGREGDVIHAVGVPLHSGSRTQVWEVRMYHSDAPDARLCAAFLCTQILL